LLINEFCSWFQTFALFWMLYAFFWVIPRHLNFICRRFGTHCLFHLHRRAGMKNSLSAYKIQTPGITQKKAYKELVLFSQSWWFQSAFNREKNCSWVSVGSGLDSRGIKVWSWQGQEIFCSL
jgi:hypothetical protein